MSILDTQTDKLFKSISTREGRDVIQTHLTEGANINGKDRQGNTPLILACKTYVDEDVVELLIKSGADNSPENGSGWTPLHYAAKTGWLQTIESLAKNGANLDAKSTDDEVSPILFAANSCEIDAVKLLIALGADVNSKCNSGWTVLHIAARDRMLDIVQLLLEVNVVDINAKTNDGDTPLHLAYRNVEMAKVLIEAGADCYVQNTHGNSLFKVLIEESHVELLKVSIANGAYIEPDDYDEMLNKPLLKERILQDIKICSKSLLNKFNSKDLPVLYTIPFCANNLPKIKQMEITDSSEIIHDIEQNVLLVKQAHGYYNFHERCPIILKMLCVRTLLYYFQ